MLRLSRKMNYAVEAVLDIAYHAGSAPVQSREITRRQGIPKRYLEQVLQHLVRHEILLGVRGPRGGYCLARERRRISVGDIARVIHEMEAGGKTAGDMCGSDLGKRVVRPLLDELKNGLMTRLDSVSIDDLCDRALRADVLSEGRANLDFSI